METPDPVMLDEMLQALEAAIARDDRASAFSHIRRALSPVFADGMHGGTRPWLPDELDDLQCRLLRSIVTATAMREVDDNDDVDDIDDPRHYQDLPLDGTEAWELGLFDNPLAIQRVVGDVRGPLDLQVLIEKRSVPMWFAIQETVAGRLSMETLKEVFEKVIPAERVGMIEDALEGPFDLVHSREARDYSDAESYVRENDYASRFIEVIASLLGDAALVGVAHARAMVEEPASPTRAMRSLVAAWVLGSSALANGEELPESIDRLVSAACKRPTFYRNALRAVLGMLPGERRSGLLADLRLFSYHSHSDPQGEVRRWRNGNGWSLVDLLEPTACTKKILAAWREWNRHRAAGNDRSALPLSGRSGSAYTDPDFADEAFPLDRAIEVLEACAEAGADALVEVRGY